MDLKDYREKTGLTQEALAGIVGISLMTMRRWESGKTKPTSIGLKKRLQRALKLTKADMEEMGY